MRVSFVCLFSSLALPSVRMVGLFVWTGIEMGRNGGEAKGTKLYLSVSCHISEGGRAAAIASGRRRGSGSKLLHSCDFYHRNGFMFWFSKE